MTLADNLRNARSKRAITQKQLAEESDVSLSYIRDLEQGKIKPRLALLELAKALNVSVEDLLR